jgi:gamma-glutamyltranspeptidase/glutathione hydrolase
MVEMDVSNQKQATRGAVFLKTAVCGMLPQVAIEAPHFATDSSPGSFEPRAYQSDELHIERHLAEEVSNKLASKDHKIVTWPDWTWKAGGVCAITVDHVGGVLAAGADQRRTSYAIGW